MIFEMCIFIDKTIYLDDNEYIECMFKDCTFILSCTDEKPIKLYKCSLDQCLFEFIGPAKYVLSFFKNFGRAAGKDAMEHLIQQMLKQ